jgi:hypothetical protein
VGALSELLHDVEIQNSEGLLIEIGMIPSSELKEVLDSSLCLLSLEKKKGKTQYSWDALGMVNAVSHVPLKDRAFAVGQLKQLRQFFDDASEMLLWSMTDDHEEFPIAQHLIKLLGPENKHAGLAVLSKLISALSGLGLTRDAAIARAIESIDLAPSDPRYAQRLIQILKTPLDQPVPGLDLLPRETEDVSESEF